MAKTSSISASDDGVAHQLTTFKNALGAYAAGLGVTPVSQRWFRRDVYGYQAWMRCARSSTSHRIIQWWRQVIRRWRSAKQTEKDNSNLMSLPAARLHKLGVTAGNCARSMAAAPLPDLL
jgi:hypothetical protein